MSEQLENLYKLQKKDFKKAGVVLADAFNNDPVWKKILGDFRTEQKQAFFESPIRYCLKYGEAYAPSDQLHGIAGWVPDDFADQTLLRDIRSGSIASMRNMGMKMAGTARQMITIFKPSETYRKTAMKGKTYIYLMIIGIASEHQGQGSGGKLLRALIEKSERAGTPIYLETSTEENMNMYKKFGFKTLDRINLPIIDLPLWIMIREPKTSNP